MSKELIYISEVEISTIIETAVNKASEKRLYTLGEAAEYLGIGEQVLRKSKHLIGFVKIGNRISFKGTDLAAYVNGNYVTPQTG